ncbi:hypothetical protein AGMMS50296_6090 [Alphaproteobacteria bacterium]|nr:hypothetical protein AGMMS50296_6090 [Alphaproteobacteria bacterium]
MCATTLPWKQRNFFTIKRREQINGVAHEWLYRYKDDFKELEETEKGPGPQAPTSAARVIQLPVAKTASGGASLREDLIAKLLDVGRKTLQGRKVSSSILGVLLPWLRKGETLPPSATRCSFNSRTLNSPWVDVPSEALAKEFLFIACSIGRTTTKRDNF